MRLLCSVRHGKECALAGLLPDGCRQGAQRLHGGVGIVAVFVAEAAVGELIGQELVENAMTVFHKAAVVHGNPQRAERQNNLRAGLGAGVAPGGVAAVVVLQFEQPLHAERDCVLDRRVRLVGRERLQNHCGHIGVGFFRADCPAAVGELLAEHKIDIHFARRLRFACFRLRNFIIAAVERQQHVGGRCDARLGCSVVIGQRGKQMIACHVRRVFSDGS